MMLTEKQAGERICLRSIRQKGEGVCVASKCMAWRWGDEVPAQYVIRHPKRTAQVEGERPSHVPQVYSFVPAEGMDDAYWIEPEAGSETRKGFCGLAGAPTVED